MRTTGARLCAGGLAALVILLGALPARALVPKDPAGDALGGLEFFRPDLHLSSSHVPLAVALASQPNAEAWNRLLAGSGPGAVVYLDPRSGTPSSLVTHIPLIPGSGAGNTITIQDLNESFAQTFSRIDGPTVAEIVRRFLEDHRDVLGIDPAQLGEPRESEIGGYLWQVAFPQQYHGIPVRYGRTLASINHGNLILIGTETWGNVAIDPNPTLGAGEAIATGTQYAGIHEDDQLWKPPSLEIVPYAPAQYEAGGGFEGPIGRGYEHRLVWVYGLVRQGSTGRWEVMVDAHTGELLAFKDTSAYVTSSIMGGVYPLSNTGVCPSRDRCGLMQSGSPMPFADTGTSLLDAFTSSGGLVETTGGIVATTLKGKYVAVSDTCGVLSESSVTGSLDLGGTNGQHDCATSGESPGNTPAARSLFYEINRLNEQARGWLPENPWLQSQTQAKVNLNNVCNAFYDGHAINLFRSGSGCGNTGELASVYDHEWGHGLDDNDSFGEMSNPMEAYADITAILRVQSSCVGYGYLTTLDAGCGATSDGTGRNANNAQTDKSDCELDCSGARGADWDRHADHLPDTPTSFTCSRCNSGIGPCGREIHCEGIPVIESVWDLVARDLRAAPFDEDSNTAFMTGNRLFYEGSGLIGNWYSCTCPNRSDGCGAGNAYMQWLTADDDNGNLSDGTPHMSAIFGAFDRHGLACPAPEVRNGGCAGGPTTGPQVTARVGSNQVGLSWTQVAGATSYWVFRGEGVEGCESGKARIATVSGTSFTDRSLANGRPYSYVVVAQGESEACFGPASACLTATPQSCAAALTLDRPAYTCADTVRITLVDSDLVGSPAQDVTVSSGTEPVPETVKLTETPGNPGVFTGSIMTTGGPASQHDHRLSVVHGDAISVRDLDASSCGTPNVIVTSPAGADCAGPSISNVRSAHITGTAAEIEWETNEPSDSSVIYDTLSPPAANTVTRAPLTAVHAVPLSGLSECTRYVYSVASTDLAGNRTSDDNGQFAYQFQTGKDNAESYLSTGPAVPIPDNDPDGASARIVVPDNRLIEDLNVRVNVTHPADGDLRLRLIGPDGTSVLLSDSRGGIGQNFTNTVFDDEAPVPISAGTAPFAGAFRPEAPLSAYGGLNAMGTWTLVASDTAQGEVGAIVDWSLSITFPPQQCQPSLEYASQTVQDSCAGLGGNSAVDPGEDIVMAVGTRNNGSYAATRVTGRLSTTTPGVTVTRDLATFPDLPVSQSATSDPPHFAFTVDESVPCGAPVSFLVEYAADQGTWTSAFNVALGTSGQIVTRYDSDDVPQPIPDLGGSLSVLTIAGHPEHITDLNVGVTISHPGGGRLVIDLIAPDETSITLSQFNGSGGNDYTNTVFDDQSTIPISSGTAPFTGSFRPAAPLSTFNGHPVDGAWILLVTDESGDAHSGSIVSWSLSVTSSVPPCTACSIAAPGAVGSLRWTPGSVTSLEWNPVANITYYKLYRGVPVSLPGLLTPAVDSCLRSVLTATTTGPSLTEVPPLGSLYWYLVTAGNGGGEGPSGNATAGSRIRDSSGDCQ